MPTDPHPTAPARHTVRVHTSDGTSLTLHLPDEHSLVIDVGGREYVGVVMPTDTGEEVRPVAVVTFDAEGEGSTTEPAGYAAAVQADVDRSDTRDNPAALPCRAWGCECSGDGVVDTPHV